MDLDDFIITVFCWIDETIPQVLAGQRLRQRGPAPQLYDSEVVTMVEWRNRAHGLLLSELGAY